MPTVLPVIDPFGARQAGECGAASYSAAEVVWSQVDSVGKQGIMQLECQWRSQLEGVVEEGISSAAAE